MKLLGEEIHSEIAMLAGLSRGRDTNDLARTALKDQQITDANVMARDGDCVWASTAIDEANSLTDSFAYTRWTILGNGNLLTVVMMVRMERMKDTVGSFLDSVSNSLTEGVIATGIVVVTHSETGSMWFLGCSFGFDSYFFSRRSTFVLGGSTFVFDVVGWLDALTVATFGDVDFCFTTRSFNVNLSLGEIPMRFSISVNARK